MYYQYFGLTEAPFSIAVNPRYLFMSARHRDALAHLLYGVETGGGFILLTGEVGTGKTTINRCLLEQLPQDTEIAIILNPALNAIELLASACDELGIDYGANNHTLKTLTDRLHQYLLDNHARGRKTVLLIDEAQHLDFDVLEQIRLLTNLETNSEKLLQIILIGQPELSTMLARPELRQLNQRITARYNLEPLNLDETGAYIRHRLQVAGMNPERVIFPPAVVRRIHHTTRGIPRVINVLCDRILLGAYGRNKTQADQGMLKLAVQEVLGDQQNQRVDWRWPAAAFAVLLVAVLFWWSAQGRNTTSVDVLADSRVSAALLPAPREPAGDVEAELHSSVRAPGIAQDAEVVAIAQSVVTIDAAVLPVAAASLAPGLALARLWSILGSVPVPVDVCPTEVYDGVACLQDTAKTWDELAVFDRPLVLSVITPERFSAEVLLLGIDGLKAWVLTADTVSAIGLAELAPLWTGDYRFLWHPPAGFEQPVALHENSPVVAAVAQMFARLDGQQQPLARSVFNTQLEQRVRLFQREYGLTDDGVVGVRTLLKLNEKLGIDATAARVREQLRAEAGEQVSP